MSLFQSLIVVALIVAASHNDQPNIVQPDSFITQTRIIEPFYGLVNAGNFHVTFVQDSQYSVQITGNEDDLDEVQTAIYDNMITIYHKGNFLSCNPAMDVVVTAPDIRKFKMAGSGSITASKINTSIMEIDQLGSGRVEIAELYADKVEIDLAGSGNIQVYQKSTLLDANVVGSGNITISGYTQKSDYKIAGSGKIFGKELINDYCDVSILGSGNLHTQIRGNLIAKIYGSGSVYYSGDPVVEKEISGSGNVIKIKE